MERLRGLRPGLVSLALILLLAACGAGGQPSLGEATGTAGAADPSPTAEPVAIPTEADAPGEPEQLPEPDATEEPAPTESPTATPEPLAPLQGLGVELIADGFDQPILVTGAPGTAALFVVEREGIIWVVEDGVVAQAPFLDLRDQMLSSSIEQGLLGLAFHPGYETNGRLFAYWTTPSGDSRLAEFTASEPTVVDVATMRVVLDVDQPAERHNAGMIAFGPEGLLYLALGDGGSGGATAQDTTSLLGSIVRLDVDNGDPYAVPAGNPFGDEIWVYGLRNPWRFSIDAVDALVYIGDVGQDTFEEINVVGLDGAGTNFGWVEMEGDSCFRLNCNTDGLTPPVLQYTHDEGCSVTGGFVYRGAAIPEVAGHYFFGDWCNGSVRSFRFEEGSAVDQVDWTSDLAAVGQVTSFGLDNDREMYTVNWEGQLFKIVPIR